MLIQRQNGLSLRKSILLLWLIIFSFLSCDPGLSDPVQIKLRSSPTKISKTAVREMILNGNYFDKYWNRSGGFKHQYELKQKPNPVVIDHTTNLVWHQSGSYKFLNLEEAVAWIEMLNRADYGGHANWRLPTLEEALSLMENERKNGSLFIDSMFDRWQWCILTGDRLDSSKSWLVAFSGRVDWFDSGVGINYVRPVCSI